jgi:hypothetical protein
MTNFPSEASEDPMDERTSESMREMVIALLKQQNQTIAEILVAQKQEMFGLFGAMADTNATGNVMQQGFETLAAQLAPLRNLAPDRGQLEADDYARLRMLRASLAREEWGRTQGLKVETLPVPYIGAALPPRQTSNVDVVFAFVDGLAPGAQEGEGRS